MKAARAQMVEEQKKFDLGTTEMLSVLQAQSKLADLDGELAAFDAVGQDEARRQQRLGLERQIALMKLQLQYEQRRRELGTLDQSDVTDAQVKLLELQRKLAALDAGITRR
jgi:outer membrane protein TolC